jgi:hypothetical protein
MFVAIAGAAAALTGLVFVAVSINLTGYLSRTFLGVEILVLGVALAAVLLPKRLCIPRNKAEPLTWTITPILVVATGTLPLVIAGSSVLAGRAPGQQWAPGSGPGRAGR